LGGEPKASSAQHHSFVESNTSFTKLGNNGQVGWWKEEELRSLLPSTNLPRPISCSTWCWLEEKLRFAPPTNIMYYYRKLVLQHGKICLDRNVGARKSSARFRSAPTFLSRQINREDRRGWWKGRASLASLPPPPLRTSRLVCQYKEGEGEASEALLLPLPYS